MFFFSFELVLSSYLSTFLSRVDLFNRLMGKFCYGVVLLAVFLQFSIVVTRYVFGFNVIWLQDLVTYGHAMIFMLGSAATYAYDGHVRIDIFYNKLDCEDKARVDFYGVLFLLYPFCLFMLWFSVPYVYESWLHLEGSFQTMGLQLVYLLKSLLLIFPISLMLQGAFTASKAYGVLSSAPATD